jgi:hypothetical protein
MYKKYFKVYGLWFISLKFKVYKFIVYKFIVYGL